MAPQPAHRPDAFEAAVIAATPILRRYALHLTRNEDRALDLVQDTFERGLRFRDQFTAGTNLNAWLATIMRHRFCELHRRAKTAKRFEIDDPEWVFAKASIHDDPLVKLQAAEVMTALGALRPIWRSAVTARIDGATDEEIAADQHISTGTVRSRIFRAREKLREFA